MIGQIRSYISFMDENSPDDYVSRIKNMIDSLPNDKDKYLVMADYLNKLNQINQIKTYLKTKKESKPKIVEPEKINIEEQSSDITVNDSKDVQKSKPIVNDKFISNEDFISSLKIRIKPYNLIRIGKCCIHLIKISFKSKPENNNGDSIINGIPTLPIIEEIKHNEQQEEYGHIKLGIYLDNQNKKWIFDSNGKLSICDLNDHIINEFKYSIDNYMLSLTDKSGIIKLFKLKKKSETDFDVYFEGLLMYKITFLGNLI